MHVPELLPASTPLSFTSGGKFGHHFGTYTSSLQRGFPQHIELHLVGPEASKQAQESPFITSAALPVQAALLPQAEGSWR